MSKVFRQTINYFYNIAYLLECRKRMLSTVRRSDTVYPAALNDRSLAGCGRRGVASFACEPYGCILMCILQTESLSQYRHRVWQAILVYNAYLLI